MMHVQETYYLAVPGQENTNYFRIKVSGSAPGVAKYNAGWYPADAVDQLFGKVDDGSESSAKQTADSIRTSYNEAILSATQNYLAIAKEPTTSSEDLANHLAAIRRVRATAGDEVSLPNGAVEIEYDPMASIALRRAGGKLVFVLSAKPSESINVIQEFAVSKETSSSILRLGDLIKQRSQNELSELQAENKGNTALNGLAVGEIDELLILIDAESPPESTEIEVGVETLRMLVENLL